ncbi:MAG: hypothetical protein ACYSSI_14565 [Planctomycetota bacterium]|jgi:hypothetical protein
MPSKDKQILRELTKKYLDICNNPHQKQRRDLWRKHNSFKGREIPIYVRAFAWPEMPECKLECEDSFYHEYEDFLRESIFRADFNDDFIFEPWVTVRASYKCVGWGTSAIRNYSDEIKGACKFDYPIKKLEDSDKLRQPYHEIDKKQTNETAEKLHDVIGDIITINIDKAPAYRMWTGDISTDLGLLRGIENIMMDMMDNAEWLHKILAFMRDGILKTHEQAEAAGHWNLSAHQNQAMPYIEGLKDPAANVNGVKRKDLWYFMAAQELTAVSPQMHNDFMLEYQLPIMKHFALTAYGCCEDLTNKIDMLRKVPNLRRIAVSPFANVEKCAQQIGTDYILSYRPSPADMVSYGLDEDEVRNILRRDLQACKGCCVDITLKDVETVQGDTTRIKKWVEIAREACEEFEG